METSSPLLSSSPPSGQLYIRNAVRTGALPPIKGTILKHDIASLPPPPRPPHDVYSSSIPTLPRNDARGRVVGGLFEFSGATNEILTWSRKIAVGARHPSKPTSATTISKRRPNAISVVTEEDDDDDDDGAEDGADYDDDDDDDGLDEFGEERVEDVNRVGREPYEEKMIWGRVWRRRRFSTLSRLRVSPANSFTPAPPSSSSMPFGAGTTTTAGSAIAASSSVGNASSGGLTSASTSAVLVSSSTSSSTTGSSLATTAAASMSRSTSVPEKSGSPPPATGAKSAIKKRAYNRRNLTVGPGIAPQPTPTGSHPPTPLASFSDSQPRSISVTSSSQQSQPTPPQNPPSAPPDDDPASFVSRMKAAKRQKRAAAAAAAANASATHGHAHHPLASVPEEPEAGEEELYCYCRSPWDEQSEMIGCDGSCQGWFHPQCLGFQKLDRRSSSAVTLVDADGRRVDASTNFLCPDCELKAPQPLESASSSRFRRGLGLKAWCNAIDAIDEMSDEEDDRSDWVGASERISSARACIVKWKVLAMARSKIRTEDLITCSRCRYAHHPRLPCVGHANKEILGHDDSPPVQDRANEETQSSTEKNERVNTGADDEEDEGNERDDDHAEMLKGRRSVETKYLIVSGKYQGWWGTEFIPPSSTAQRKDCVTVMVEEPAISEELLDKGYDEWNDEDVLALSSKRILESSVSHALNANANSPGTNNQAGGANKRPRVGSGTTITSSPLSAKSAPPSRKVMVNSPPKHVTMIRVPYTKVVPFEFPTEEDAKHRGEEFVSRIRPRGVNGAGPLLGVVELSNSGDDTSSSSSDQPRNSFLARLQLVPGDENSYISLGRFATRLDAARAHDFAALLQFGDDAELNFNDIVLSEERNPPELNKWFLKIVEGPSTPLSFTPSNVPPGPLTADWLRVDLLSVADWCENLLHHAPEMLALTDSTAASSSSSEAGPSMITRDKVKRYVDRLNAMKRVLRAAVFRTGAKITSAMLECDLNPERFQDLESCEEIKEALRRTRGGRKRTNSG